MSHKFSSWNTVYSGCITFCISHRCLPSSTALCFFSLSSCEIKRENCWYPPLMEHARLWIIGVEWPYSAHWYREDSCNCLIRERERPADNQPCEWYYQDTNEKLWKFLFKCEFTLTTKYLHDCHIEQEQGKNNIDKIRNEYPNLEKILSQSEKITHGPIWREEPSCEDNCGGNDYQYQTQYQIQNNNDVGQYFTVLQSKTRTWEDEPRDYQEVLLLKRSNERENGRKNTAHISWFQ